MSKDKLDIVAQVVENGRALAAKATAEFLAQYGDRDCCGFAWVTVYEKGSTKMGRALLKSGYFEAYGGGLQMWNPSGSLTQSISAKEEGANAMARFLTEQLGVKAYAGSRMD